MKNLMSLSLLSAAVALAGGCASFRSADSAAAPNSLSEAERAEGWELLWDGASFDGWVGVRNGCKAPPAMGWTADGGELTIHSRKEDSYLRLSEADRKAKWGGDLVTVRKFGDFDLVFEFKLTEGANSGVKYYFDERQNSSSCEEYQVLNPDHPDAMRGKSGNRRVASLYDLIPADAERLLKPTGEWNSGRIVAKGQKVQHWLNGEKVVEYVRGSAEFRSLVRESKYSTWGKAADGKPQPWGELAEGRILLQDHTDHVSFRNLKIKAAK